MMDIATLLALVLATFASEDLACVSAGVLIVHGRVDAAAAILACTAGIFIGDVGLWALGRAGASTARRCRWLRGRVPAAQVNRSRAWLERRGAVAILASRFVPGTRLPLYMTAGLSGMSLRLFAFWTFIAALVWTPVVVLASAHAGGAVIARSTLSPGTVVALIAGLVLALRSAHVLRARHVTASGTVNVRTRLAARIARWRRWEFWPMWLFYAPVAAWVAWLAIRHRGLTTMTAANPGIADGGTVGESKFAILRKLAPEFTIPAALIPSGTPCSRLAHADGVIAERNWEFPIVAKPDAGQRGVGVRLIRSRAELADYLISVPDAVLLQPFHAGPYEAGVFYYRLPGQSRGQILSITDKQFPVLVGDGSSTIEELIYRHPRFRLQADVFMRRHAQIVDRVLAAGERLQLAVAGNHAQGTTFRDGRHLLTAALEQSIDAIAKTCDGFFIGRFDIRYRDVAEFKAGRDLAIVELNGATAESTNIYDPDTSLIDAYRQLFTQWSLVFRIAAENRRRGAVATSFRRLSRLVGAHIVTRPVHALSD